MFMFGLICILDDIMDGDLFCNILESMLFIWEKLPDYWFIQDNETKHLSRGTHTFLEELNTVIKM